MFKRKARILFVAAQDDNRAQMARALAEEHGGEYLEARADTAPGAAQTLQWADLIVSFDAAVQARLAPLAPHTRTKLWPLPEASDAQMPARLEEKVGGMIGGLRMLSRLDED